MEKQSAASCPVLGGKKMVLSGHNFLQDSKVIFVEKAPGTSCMNRPWECFPALGTGGIGSWWRSMATLRVSVLGSRSRSPSSACVSGLPSARWPWPLALCLDWMEGALLAVHRPCPGPPCMPSWEALFCSVETRVSRLAEAQPSWRQASGCGAAMAGGGTWTWT